MISVLHVSQPTVGGLPWVVRELSLDQAGRGWDVAVASPTAGPLRRWLKDAGVRHLPWEATLRPGPAYAREARALSAMLRAFRPDVVHLHAYKAGFVGRLVLRGRRCTVFQPHSWPFESEHRVLGLAALAWERFAARWSDVILCVSDAERRRAERAGVSGAYRVIPNGVDLSVFRPAGPEERRAARARLGLDEEPLVVCVGRLHHQKGQDVLLGAWPAVRAAVPHARLALVGDGPDRAVLESRATLGATLVGDRSDVPDWLAAADVVAAPSRWEGMALTVLEAMAVGRSVVASAASGMRELLEGGAGGVVPVEDARALQAALVPRLRNPGLADAEGAEGRRRVEERHDVRGATAEVARLYEEVLEARRSR